MRLLDDRDRRRRRRSSTLPAGTAVLDRLRARVRHALHGGLPPGGGRRALHLAGPASWELGFDAFVEGEHTEVLAEPTFADVRGLMRTARDALRDLTWRRAARVVDLTAARPRVRARGRRRRAPAGVRAARHRGGGADRDRRGLRAGPGGAAGADLSRATTATRIAHGSVGHGGDHLLPAFVSPSLDPAGAGRRDRPRHVAVDRARRSEPGEQRADGASELRRPA